MLIHEKVFFQKKFGPETCWGSKQILLQQNFEH